LKSLLFVIFPNTDRNAIVTLIVAFSEARCV